MSYQPAYVGTSSGVRSSNSGSVVVVESADDEVVAKSNDGDSIVTESSTNIQGSEPSHHDASTRKMLYVETEAWTRKSLVEYDLHPSSFTFDHCQNNKEQAKEHLEHALRLSGEEITFPAIYNPDVAKDPLHSRHYSIFPFEVDIPKQDEVKVIKVEFRLPVQSFTQVDLAESQRDREASDFGDKFTFYLNLSHEAIASQLRDKLGGADFDLKAYHATILFARVSSAVNSTDSSFRVRLEVPNMNYKKGDSAYNTHSLALGVCNPSCGNETSILAEKNGSFAHASAHQFVATLPADHKGPLEKGMDTAYRVPGRWNSPECRRWSVVDVPKALAAAKLLKVGTTDIQISDHFDPLVPSTLAQYILVSHEQELMRFSAELGVRSPFHTIFKKKGADDRGTWTINYEVYEKTLLYLSNIYANLAVNLNASLRLALTHRDGSQGWKDMMSNGMARIDANDHKPVHIDVTLEIGLMAFNGKEMLTPEMEETIRKINQYADDTKQSLQNHIDRKHHADAVLDPDLLAETMDKMRSKFQNGLSVSPTA
jgi:hypothetical protein